MHRGRGLHVGEAWVVKDGVGQGQQGQQVPQAPDHDDGDNVGDKDRPVVLDVLGQAVLLALGAGGGAGQAPGALGRLGVRQDAAGSLLGVRHDAADSLLGVRHEAAVRLLGVRGEAAVGRVGCCGRLTFNFIGLNLLLGSEVWIYLMCAELNPAAKEATSSCVDHSCTVVIGLLSTLQGLIKCETVSLVGNLQN